MQKKQIFKGTLFAVNRYQKGGLKLKKYYIFCFLVFLLTVLSVQSIYSQQWVIAGYVPNPGQEPSISVVDGNNVWIAGGVPDTPRIYRSINGGLNWTPVQTSGISTEPYCLWAVDPNTVFVAEGVVNSYAKLLKTTNAGVNWNVLIQTGQNEGYFNSLIFSRSNPLVGGALADKIYITSNGGINWIQQNTGVLGVSSAQNSLMLIDEHFYGFGLNNGAARVRMTTNGGIGWAVQALNLVGNFTSGLAFKNDKLTGLSSTSTSMPIIARTVDGGTTWTSINIGTGLSGITKIKWVPGTNVVYIMGENGEMKRSTNDGLNWVSLTTAGASEIAHFNFVNINGMIYGYAVARTGDVLKLADSILIITGTNNNSTEVPSEYKLFQNYPNPFNPVTQIKFDLPYEGFVKLTIYNVLGQEVTRLVNEFKPAGSYVVNFNTGQSGSSAALTSGIYFYKLESGNFMEVRKMTLLK